MQVGDVERAVGHELHGEPLQTLVVEGVGPVGVEGAGVVPGVRRAADRRDPDARTALDG